MSTATLLDTSTAPPSTNPPAKLSAPSAEASRSFRVIGTEHDRTYPVSVESTARILFENRHPSETILSVTELIRKVRA